MVQVEAALCGTPTVASDLPGVRIASRLTGMGLTVPPRDPAALAEAVCAVLSHRDEYVHLQAYVAKNFAPDTIAGQYEHLFEEMR